MVKKLHLSLKIAIVSNGHMFMLIQRHWVPTAWVSPCAPCDHDVICRITFLCVNAVTCWNFIHITVPTHQTVCVDTAAYVCIVSKSIIYIWYLSSVYRISFIFLAVFSVFVISLIVFFLYICTVSFATHNCKFSQLLDSYSRISSFTFALISNCK